MPVLRIEKKYLFISLVIHTLLFVLLIWFSDFGSRLYLPISVVYVDIVQTRKPEIGRGAYVYGALLIIAVLTVFRALPVWFGALVLVYASVFDRKALHIDYSLLITLIGFIGLSENISILLASRLEHSGHIFILSSLSSQFISNVPAAVLFAKFTTQWKALLWGANVGGFGSLVSSFANLIAYKLYIGHESGSNAASFTIKFISLGYVMLLAGMALYRVVGAWL